MTLRNTMVLQPCVLVSNRSRATSSKNIGRHNSLNSYFKLGRRFDFEYFLRSYLRQLYIPILTTHFLIQRWSQIHFVEVVSVDFEKTSKFLLKFFFFLFQCVYKTPFEIRNHVRIVSHIRRKRSSQQYSIGIIL